jgi:hypothetical protein
MFIYIENAKQRALPILGRVYVALPTCSYKTNFDANMYDIEGVL